jgi:hypothetical protein
MDFSKAKLDKLNFRLALDDVDDGETANISKFSKPALDAVRYACLTNLRFLANCVLRGRSKKFLSLNEAVHGQIIDALIRPDPDVDLEDWDPIKQCIVLASRGIIKSTLGAAFLTQVILCCPDIRILIISGKLKKAESILKTARNPFLENHVLRFLFPEWAIEEGDVKVGEFTCPKRDKELNYRDPTLETSSFDSVKAGGHYEIILFDDATNEINSNNVENCEKTHDQYGDTYPLVEPGGYRIFFGTKWNDSDLPSHIKASSDDQLVITGQPTTKYFTMPAWVLRTDGNPTELEQRSLRERTGGLTPADVVLTWPEKLTEKFLFTYYREDKLDFYKQYLLDTTAEQQKSFLPETVERQFITNAKMRSIVPYHEYMVFIHWDMAGVLTRNKKKSETDYSCGFVGIFDKSTGKLYFVNCILAHFTGTDDTAKAIVQLFMWAEKYGPIHGHSIEDANNTRLFEDSIERAVQVLKPKKWMPVNYIVPDMASKAKNARIAGLASAMEAGSVFFSKEMPYNAEVKAQLKNWDINSTRRKDDAPDCAASIWKHYKSLIAPNQITSLQTDGPVLSWEPEGPVEAPDPHADEKANADIEWLSKDTVLFN